MEKDIKRRTALDEGTHSHRHTYIHTYTQTRTHTMLLLPLVFWAVLCSAQYVPNLQPDNRTLDEIYESAKSESGVLQVAFGGDGMSQIAFGR